MTTQLAIGERLRWLRLQQKLEQREVAARLGISASSLSRYETGMSEIGSTQIEAFARALDVTPRQLIDTLFSDILNSAEQRALHFRHEQSGAFSGRLAALGAGA